MPIVFHFSSHYKQHPNEASIGTSSKGGKSNTFISDDFGGVSIIGLLYNNEIFLPRGILWSGSRIMGYSNDVANSVNQATGINESIEEIPQLGYFNQINPPIPMPLNNGVPCFFVAPLEGEENVINSKQSVKDALEKIGIDFLYYDPARVPISIDVDFRFVQGLLVNVGRHGYGVPYVELLVIPIP